MGKGMRRGAAVVLEAFAGRTKWRTSGDRGKCMAEAFRIQDSGFRNKVVGKGCTIGRLTLILFEVFALIAFNIWTLV